MATLYELQGAYRQLLELEEDTDPTLFHDTLDSIADTIEDKAIGYAKVINQLNSDAEQLKKEELRLHGRRSSIENKVRILKDNLTQAMIETDQRKIKSPEFNIYIQKNPAKLVIPDEQKVNASYFHTELVLDKKSIKEDLKAGKEVLGASLEQSESVRIR